jgi:hypothetical protein
LQQRARIRARPAVHAAALALAAMQCGGAVSATATTTSASAAPAGPAAYPTPTSLAVRAARDLGCPVEQVSVWAQRSLQTTARFHFGTGCGRRTTYLAICDDPTDTREECAVLIARVELAPPPRVPATGAPPAN